jgi:hypothetical protein
VAEKIRAEKEKEFETADDAAGIGQAQDCQTEEPAAKGERSVNAQKDQGAGAQGEIGRCRETKI